MTRIGWIGTGVMGASMCGHLLAAGHEVTVTTRTRAKVQPLLDGGAAWADTPAEVAAGSEVVFSMVGYPDDVRAVMLADDGVFGGAAPGTVVVDMTTSDPMLAQELGERGAVLGLRVLDAPVSGGDVGARNGTLSIMVGGPADTFATVLASVASGAAGSWALSNLAPRIANGDFAPGFFVDHFVKDMGLVLAEAHRMQLALPNLALVHQLYLALQAQGHGRSGTQALVHALAALSGITWD